MNREGGVSVRTRMNRTLVLAAILGLVVGCVPAEPEEEGSLIIVAMAGPTCPVETDPPDPDCAPRPVEGAPILVTPADGSGIVIAQGETDAEGRLTLPVPAGDYLVTAGEVEGLTAATGPVLVTILPNLSIEQPIAYDTGIR